LNLFSNLLYIPICFAYIVPASRFGWPAAHSTTTTSRGSSDSSSSSSALPPSLWPRKRLLKQFAVMGALDSLAMTLQTFAAVYLPGPLLILLPQAAIPVSLALTAVTSREGVTWPQWVGAATVLIGIWIVLEPVLSSQHAPDFYCEAADRENDCTVCQVALTEQACLAAQTTRPIDHDSGLMLATERWLRQEDDVDSACRWLPFGESSQEKEFLEIFWSIILMASTVPMALSAIYKQRAMLAVSSPPERNPPESATTHQQQLPTPPALYVSGWIAVFQFVCSLVVAIPAGMLASPTVRPWDVPENIFNGMLCYAGKGVIETGCHPDTLCASQHAAVWVNVTVLCHAVYTVSMMLVLQGSRNSVLLFLALTVIIPIGNLAFTMPFMPHQSQTVVRTADLAGLIVILVGLVLYRFSDPSETPSKTDKREQDDEYHRLINSGAVDALHDVNEEPFTSRLCWTWAVENQTSYTLLREPILTGDV
jgi:CRT-like, chloroquine-resistance transporter-like